MKDIRQIFSVPFRYTVHFTRNLFAVDNRLLPRILRDCGPGPSKTIVVVDNGVCTGRKNFLETIAAHCARHPQAIDLVCPPISVPGGERVKNTGAWVDRIHKAIHTYSLCRHSYVVAVGGGAVLDMAGYAAATAHRGIRLVRVPTTVLSQNDSGVGVKNSINAFGNKNFLGTFVPPCSVINDSSFLETLTDRDWRSGTSEAVKVAALRDPEFFQWIERHAKDLAARGAKAMDYLIHRCAALHLQHIAASNDPFETGSSRPLDFGHWSAHKLELLTSFRLKHGEAVAIGLALDSTYAYRTGLLLKQDWQRMLAVLSNLGFKLKIPKPFRQLQGRDNPQSLEHGLTQFREHLGGELTLMMLQKIGAGIEIHSMDDRILQECIDTLNQV